PMSGLARASAFLITRSDEAPNTYAIEFALRRLNPKARVFRARTVPDKWIDAAGGEHEPSHVSEQAALAFCGLGNPNAFWRTLARIGIKPLACIAYDDHHQYSPSEVRRLAQHARDLGSRMLLTTAKDAVNLPPDYAAILGDLQLYRLEIRTEIEEEAELVKLMQGAALR
ncbi:MAG TPA: tetraacyldisaccharide 4'-kinase, partial [Bryobacteraceae bacterium]|nr:tetraacyldisaccharide 4'-kinase [Bryobacteraceae bacterium]